MLHIRCLRLCKLNLQSMLADLKAAFYIMSIEKNADVVCNSMKLLWDLCVFKLYKCPIVFLKHPFLYDNVALCFFSKWASSWLLSDSCNLSSQETHSAAELSSRMKGAGGVGEGWQQQGQRTGPLPPPGGQSQITFLWPRSVFPFCRWLWEKTVTFGKFRFVSRVFLTRADAAT